MDKDRKLKRYRRKDYREVVGFPVEIVGRDGVVRRYDFEESIRLYQRRMSYAPMRFRDDDVVAAEQGHCKARIDQLRRSFFHLHGWPSDEGASGPEAAHPEVAGELAAFLVRVFRTSGRLSVGFERLEQDAGEDEVWWVSREGREGGFLLYGFVFGTGRGHATQEAFFARLGQLRATERAAGDVERLVAFHHTNDCGFVLTGRAEDVADIAAIAPDGEDAAQMDPTPWDEVVEFIRRGDFPTAFLRCRWILKGQPWHRDAYAAGAMLSVVLRRPGDAEDMAFVGTGYFPDDGLLQYYMGLSRLHQGRLDESETSLRTALEAEPGLMCARSLYVVVLVERGRWVQALRQLDFAATPQNQTSRKQDADRIAHERLRRVLVRGAFVILASLVGLCLGFWALAVVGEVALIPLGAMLGAIGLGASALRRQFDRATHRLRFEDLVPALQRVQERRAERVG
jgi:hypothetical protein